MKPMISTKNMIHSFSSFLHRSIAVRPNALCAATCVYSLSRRLPAACLILVSLLLSLPMNAKEWYGEVLKTSTTYYIYSEGAGFLNDDSKIYNTPKDKAVWTFSSTTKGTIKSNNGRYIYIKQPSLHSQDGTATANGTTSWTGNITQNIVGSGAEQEYFYYFYDRYSITVPFVGTTNYDHYFNIQGNLNPDGTNTFKTLSQNNASNTEWKLISQRQVQSRIDISTTSLDFGALTLGDSATRSTQVTYYNLPSDGLRITLSYADNGLYVYANGKKLGNGNGTYTAKGLGTYSSATLTFIYKPTAVSNEWTATATISTSQSEGKDKETITIKGSATKLTYSPIWNTGEYVNVGEIIANPVALPPIVKGAGANITGVISSNPSVISISTDGDGNYIATALQEGDATLTASISGDGSFNREVGSESKIVSVTSKTKQYIQWGQAQALTTLSPGSNVGLTAKVVDAEGNEIVGRTITYTFTPDYGYSDVADVSGSSLSCANDGKGVLTATQAGDETYAPCSMSLPIVVHTSSSCKTEEDLASDYSGNQITIKKDQPAGPFSMKLPAKISFNYYRDRDVTRNFLVKAKYEDGTEKILAQLYGGTNYPQTPYSYDVDKSLIQISFICEAANKSYVKDIKYTPAQYVEPSMEEITFSSSVGTAVSNKVNIDWCNIVWHAEVRNGKTSDATINPHFEVTTGYFGGCDKVGSDDITITYTPTEGHNSENPEQAYLCIFKDGQAKPFKTIPISAIADKLNPIVSWDLSSVTDITKSYYLDQMPPKTNSTGTITYTSGNENIATIKDNGEHTVLQFKTSGKVTLTATIAETSVHKGVSVSREITLNKVDVTRDDNYPKQYYVIAGQSLQDCELDINDFKVTYNGNPIYGKVSWENPTKVPSNEQYTVIFTPDPAQNGGKDWYNPTRFENITVTALQRPTFTCSPLSIDFGTASVIDGGSSPLTFSKLNNQGQTLTWHREFSGTNWNCFAIDGAISNSGCTVRFNPQDATAHTATLTIWATYTAEGLTVESARQTISLSGTGYIPEAGLKYSLSTYDFGDVNGVKQASQEVGVQFVAVDEISNTSFSWKKGNSNNIFQFNYTADGTYGGKVAITAGVNTPVAATTVYEDVLVVKAKKSFSSDEEITAELPVKITLHPRQANTLALNIVEDGQNGIKAALKNDGVTVDYYYIYTDDKNVPIFQSGSRNNTEEPISITPASGYDTYFTIDEGNYTIQPVSHSAGNISVQCTQEETDEYTGFSQTINLRVKRHTPVITIQGLEFSHTDRGYDYYYALQNTDYSTLDFVRTTNTEMPLSVVATNNTDYISLNQIGDLSWGFTTFNTLNSTKDVNLTISQEGSTNYEPITTQKYCIRIIKDPRHVGSEGSIPNRCVWVKKSLWENTAAGMNGKTFTNDIVNAEWVGDQWVNSKWTGTNWANTGNGNAYVLHDGGSVVFNFTGVPYYTYITRYFAANATSGGLLTVEESQDGITWTGIQSTSTRGGSTIYMDGNSHYLRLSYDKNGTAQEYIVLWNYIRERAIATATEKFVQCVQQTSNGDYKPATVVLKTANWGLNWTKSTPEGDKVPIVEVINTNPAFSISINQPESNGIDDYQEVRASISYNPALDTEKSGLGQITLSTSCANNKGTAYYTTITVQAVAAAKATIQIKDTANVGIQTGTVAPASKGSFHRGLREVKLTHCFDASTGNALFDRLYIFGITNNTNGRSFTDGYPQINHELTMDPESPTRIDNALRFEFNASTFCYVYTKGEDGKSYNYDAGLSFDATQKRFDHGSSLNGKKLYFTGYCPFANMGTKPSEEGWMYFTGGNSDGVDIYLEDCEIMGRYKTASGCGHSKDYTYNEVKITIGKNWLTGCSSIFVFKSNQTKSGIYTPKIHILGNNHLKGQAGSLISKVIGTVGGFLNVDAGINATGTASAPISILADGNEGVTNLIFDDIWANNDTTNGFLKLDATGMQVGIADLGSKNGTLTFNGGQYNVRNSAADGQYTCNIMACYRAYTKTVAGQDITLNGFGADQPAGCKVTINSGTFTMTKNMQQISSKDYNGGDYYIDQENFMDLRLPGNSIVNGGTFNGINEVVRCTSTTSQGSRPISGMDALLCPYYYKPSDVGEVKTLKNNAVSIHLPNNSIGMDITTDAQIAAINGGYPYGGQSINLDKDGYVHVYLPSIIEINGSAEWSCEELAQIVFEQWAACTPSATASSVDQSGGFTGETTVQSDTIDGVVYKTNRLLYAEMDENITKGSYKDGDISIQFTNEHGEIVNEKDYTIHKELVSMVAVKADRWMAFVAPFDIYEVRIIEAADEDTLALKYSNDKAGALAYQATENICFSYKLANYVVKDLAGGRTTSMSFNDLAGMCIRNMAYDAQQSKYNRGYYTLDHYDGSNIMTANYYLYEIDNAEDTCIFPTNGTGTALEIKWKPVAKKASAARADSSVLMKKGHVYAIQFPYCPMCNDVDTRTTYDYWTGKLIVFHGTGPQKVSGTNRQAAIKSATAEAGKAVLTGNYTFANLSAPAGIYAHNTTYDLFERTNSATTIKPMQGYMLFSSPIANATALSISRAGRISYEYDSDITTDDHIPTIGSRASMLVYRTDNGFAVDPVRTQRVMLYNLNGQLLFNGTLTEGERHGFNLTQGIYLLKGEEEIIKVMVN